MAEEMIARYRLWFEHEGDAHDKALASLETVPVDRRGSAEYQKAVTVMAHVVAARRLWLSRLGVLPPTRGPLFPENADASQVAAEWRVVQAHWTGYLASIDDGELTREFEYQSLDAGRFRNRIEDILAQLFAHSAYHRGQIAMLVRTAGGQPAITDFIYWRRQPVAAEQA